MTICHSGARGWKGSGLELWGGHECTVNRVGDGYRDQTRLTGHHHRPDDLARFAELGIATLRYPVLWERVAPDRPDARDWRWSDERLAAIARLGMRPIVGLLHHGSGPRYTDLVDANFAALFADHAAATARRYPEVVDWTPINEPLTTARFSGLYGLWYPHARDERSFWTALLNQVDATRMAMAAIRAVNPGARLIQTDDLGQYHSTPELAGVADHLNHRRWASWDLLTGRFTPDHPLWEHVAGLGLGDRLRAIADDPCPPDLLGINFYPTSERFLDDRLDGYPGPPPAEGYHDIAASRVMAPPPPGLPMLMRQAWARYGLPMAVTESHLGCSREEQLRWLAQSWRTCLDLKAEGVDVRALTAWALLGAVDWNSLITVDAGHYEPGAFDVSSGEPRPTAVAHLLKALAAGTRPTDTITAVAGGRGWWQRDMRLEYPSFAWAEPVEVRSPVKEARPILITGATGTLGRALAGGCELRGLPYLLTDRAAFPIEDGARVAAFLDKHRPWAVVNAAGWVRVDDAEENAAACLLANRDGPAVLATACARRTIPCVLFSTDLVFDGSRRTPYLEDDAPSPLNVYGRSKAEAEALADRYPATVLAIRTAAFFSPYDPHNFAMAVERALRDGQPFDAAGDSVVSPTFVPDLVRACLDLVIDGERGLWHLANDGEVSWLAFGRMIAQALGLDAHLIRAADAEQLGWRARRPAYAALGSRRGRLLPSLDDAIARHAVVRRAGG